MDRERKSRRLHAVGGDVMKNGLCLLILIFATPSLWAREGDSSYGGPAQWTEFREYVVQQQEENERVGLGYMISGAVAAVGGGVGYYQSEEVFSRTIFAITSNVGLMAIGWGATQYWTSSELDTFFYAIEGSSLSAAEKNEVLQRYLYKERKENERRRWIRVATHALIAVANLYSASQEQNSEVRSVFYFLGGANTLLAISYSF